MFWIGWYRASSRAVRRVQYVIVASILYLPVICPYRGKRKKKRKKCIPCITNSVGMYVTNLQDSWGHLTALDFYWELLNTFWDGGPHFSPQLYLGKDVDILYYTYRSVCHEFLLTEVLWILWGNAAKTGVIWRQKKVMTERVENLSNGTDNRALEKMAVGDYELPMARSI